MSELVTLLAVEQWPENEYEGSVFFKYHGREIEARAILSGDEEWATWTKGRKVNADIYLERWGPVLRESRPPSFVRVGRVSYEAAGRVLEIIDDEEFDNRLVLDVGFRLVVDMNPTVTHPGPMPEVGDEIFLSGEMQLCSDD